MAFYFVFAEMLRHMGGVCDGMDLCWPDAMGKFLCNIPKEFILTWCVQGIILHLSPNISLSFFCVERR